MSPALATATRLLTALDELLTEETILLRTQDYVEAVAVRERAAPVVEKLCALAADFSADSVFRLRLEDLLDRGEQNLRLLDSELARCHDELLRVGEAHGKLRRMAPAYRTARSGLAASGSRFDTAA